MSYYLWEMRPYFRQVAGQLVLGSITGFIMNTAVVLPADRSVHFADDIYGHDARLDAWLRARTGDSE